MIESIIIAYLNNVLDVPAFAEVPKDAPKAFVVVEKTGGGESGHIAHPTIIVQSYEESLYKAALLNKRVKMAMLAAITLPEISSVELNASYNYTFEKQYRYQAVYDITYYEED